MPLALRVRVSAVSALVVSACGLEIPQPSYVTTTEILTIRHSVVELGPLHPDRVGPIFADQPAIAEVLPGDRLRLEAIVIDRDGQALADDAIETLWVQCGYGSCAKEWHDFADWSFGRECSQDTNYTMDSPCVLGSGTASFEFIVPELGFDVLSPSPLEPFSVPHMRFFGVVAWGGRAAADCWASRRTDQAALDRCDFTYREVTVGPYWWLLAYAAQLGFPIDDGIDELPPLVFLQPANRIPKAPVLSVWVDGELRGEGASLPTIMIEPGSRIDVELRFDWVSQLLQGHYVPITKDAVDAFELVPEQVLSRTLTTGAIRRLGGVDPDEGHELPLLGDGSFTYEVDAYARPGRSRILIVYRDTFAATDWSSVDFEVQ